MPLYFERIISIGQVLTQTWVCFQKLGPGRNNLQTENEKSDIEIKISICLQAKTKFLTKFYQEIRAIG